MKRLSHPAGQPTLAALHPARETSGNEHQTRPATEIEYLGRRSPLCGLVLRDHFREHLIRCQASSRMCRQSCAGASGRIFLLRDLSFTSWRPQFHLMGSPVSTKRTPVSFQTFTHSSPTQPTTTHLLLRFCCCCCAPARHTAVRGTVAHHP